MIEKKFLLKHLPVGAKKTEEQIRYFLVIKPSFEIRIQQTNNKYELEFKVKLPDGSVKLSATKLPKLIYIFLKLFAVKSIWRDTYFIADHQNFTLRVYHGLSEGLIRAEIDFENIDQADNFKPDAWLGREITNSDLSRDSKLVFLSKEKFLKLLSE